MAETDLTLRIIGPDPQAHEVPASVLLQTLEGLQQLVWQIAYHREGRQLRLRQKFSAILKEHFALQLAPAEKGSYLVHARVGKAQPELIPPPEYGAVVQDLTAFCSAAVAGKSDELVRILPDRSQRFRAVDRLRKLAPLPGSGYRFELQNSVGPAIVLRDSLQGELDKLLIAADDELGASVEVVTGKLIEVNFDDHNLTLLYAPTRRKLTCEYDETVEPLLFENRRDLIQVRGKVRMGRDDHPEKIVEADYIGELDLTPFTLTEVAYGDLRLRFKQPRVLTPVLDESEQVLCLEDESLNLSAHAQLRSDLFEEVRTCLSMLWQEYALAPDEILDPVALDLKKRLLDALEELPHA